MEDKNFTHPKIKGIPHKTMLTEGTALVLEGGGTRGFYTAGVFDAFIDAGIMFPYITGVSAGAANVLTYVAGQKGRTRQIIKHYVGDKRYVSKRNILRNKSLFGYDFIFRTVPKKHIFWDSEIFENTNIRLLTGATDCATGEPFWFEKSDLAPEFMPTIASCSVPLLSQMVKIGDRKFLDGGLSAPIPIEKSVADGNNFHVIVLTRNEGYVQEAFRYKRIANLFYRKHPRLVDAILNRHEIYNRQLKLCEQLEHDKKAIIIRPQIPLTVGRATSDTAKLLALYDEGHTEGAQAVQLISALLNT
ncbi:MAG: patatin family protein [Defluviitaleaceae bacterium]|nr:patatin family protein [Defluviitaleaceae bacterium]MCL2263078.1 patatin family protein [Defluviitaleaceae bacterium]